MSWLKGLFGGKSDGSLSFVSLSDRKYEQLFLQGGGELGYAEATKLKFRTGLIHDNISNVI
jgi:hypothetical protein